MLPRVNRLTKKKDFELVFKRGESFKHDFLLFKIAKNHLNESRFGFVVSKKVSRKANKRNTIKRRLRKAVANTLPEGKQSMDVIVIALPAIAKKEFLEIQETVVTFLNKYR